MILLGVDFGTKRVGVAASDPDGRVALPLRALDGRQGLRAQFADVLSEHPAELIVIGNPVSLNGSHGPMSDKVRRFAQKLEKWFSIPCVLWDERFTSSQAREAAPNSSRASGHRDAAAAGLILQSYIDAQQGQEDC